MTVWLNTLASVGFLSLLSLIGVFALTRSGLRELNRFLTYLISLAAGILLGGALFHLLPEAAESIGTGTAFSTVLAVSFVVFFLLEKFLLLHHHGTAETNFPAHAETALFEGSSRNQSVQPFVWVNLLGGAIHNMVDGVTIAAAFLLHPTLGATTVIATCLHEIPREIGDFAVLVHGGLPVKRALLFNFLTSISSVAAAIAALLIGTHLKGYTDWLLPVAAANFLYIALANLLPELNHVRNLRQSLQQAALLIFGMALMYFLKQAV